MKGDLNLDQSIDILDVINISHYVLEIIEFTELQKHQSDFDADFIVNIVDLIFLVNLILS